MSILTIWRSSWGWGDPRMLCTDELGLYFLCLCGRHYAVGHPRTSPGSCLLGFVTPPGVCEGPPRSEPQFLTSNMMMPVPASWGHWEDPW